MEQSLIQASKPILLEGVIVIFLGLFIVSMFTVLDIRFHDFYVREVVAFCFPENQDQFCTNIRAKHNVGNTAQIDIGNVYWQLLAQTAVFIGILMFTFRMIIAFMLQQTHMHRIRIHTIFMAIMWGLVGSTFFLTGILDTLYYWFQGEDIPTELAWLSGAGLFQETKSWTGDPDIVEIQDLYLTNLVGLAVIGFIWFITMISFANSGLSKRRIA